MEYHRNQPGYWLYRVVPAWEDLTRGAPRPPVTMTQQGSPLAATLTSLSQEGWEFVAILQLDYILVRQFQPMPL